MSTRDFMGMDYETFMEAVYQWEKSRESLVKLLWETTRFNTAQLMRPNLKNPNAKINEICPLPWDNAEREIERALDAAACADALDGLDGIE